MRVDPRGSSASSPRTMTLRRASRGSPSSRTSCPAIASSGPTGYSTISAPSRRTVPISTSGRGSAGSDVVTPSLRASHSTVVPCSSVESTTAKKTMLKNSLLCSTPSITGKVASTTGTAPRSPAQLSTTRSPVVKRSSAVATNVGQGPRDEDEDQRERGPLEPHVAELAREDEQAEREEHRDLGDPREALVEDRHRLLRRGCGPSRARAPRGTRRGSRSRGAWPRRRRRAPRSRASRPGTGPGSRAGCCEARRRRASRPRGRWRRRSPSRARTGAPCRARRSRPAGSTR